MIEPITRTPRIVQLTGGMNGGATGKPILAALDDQGRVWIADPSTPSVPYWRQVEPIEEPVKTALVDPAEPAGLRKELEASYITPAVIGISWPPTLKPPWTAWKVKAEPPMPWPQPSKSARLPPPVNVPVPLWRGRRAMPLLDALDHARRSGRIAAPPDSDDKAPAGTAPTGAISET